MKKHQLIIFLIILAGIFGVVISTLNYNDYYQATKHIRRNPKLKEDPRFTRSSYAKYDNLSQFFNLVIVPSSTKGIVKGKYIDKSDHGMPYLYIETDEYYYMISTTTDLLYNDDGLYDYVLEKDSIFKNKGSAIYTVKRGNVIKNFKVGKESEYWINPYYESYSDTLLTK